MGNTLFGSGSTKLTSGVVSGGFNLDTGLYEAMYEQSQMQLKIFEAMVKADSLSRKYRAQGIYSESAIQAFNEEAKTKIGKALAAAVAFIRRKILEWWAAFKRWVDGVIDKIKNRFSKKKANGKDTSGKDTSPKAIASTGSTSDLKALPAASPKKQSPVQQAVNAEPKEKEAKMSADPNKPIVMGGTVNKDADYRLNEIIDKNGDVEVEWPSKDTDWVATANDMLTFVTNEYTFNHIAKAVTMVKNAANGDAYSISVYINKKVEGSIKLDDPDSYFTKKKIKEIANLIKDGGIAKILADKKSEISKMDNIIRGTIIKKLEQFEQEVASNPSEDAVYYTAYVSAFNKELIGSMENMQAIAKREFECYTAVSARLNTIRFENADLLVEAAMYEVFMSTESYAEDYDLYSAEGIKRFAAARLEAAMDEISDVIDNAINSDNAQGIENVNLADTDVLGAGVSNDPNKLVYDDDCYSQGGTFGDENIAGYVDANIAGTSTSVARGNETKAAMEGFLFNW